MRPVISRVLNAKDILFAKKNRIKAYESVFSTPQGKKVLQHIMQEGYVTKSTFVAGDPHETTLNEGSRRLALSILKAATGNHNEQISAIEEQLTNEHIP